MIFFIFSVVAQITTTPHSIIGDPNGNHDSGYVPSNVDDILTGTTPPESPRTPRSETGKTNGTERPHRKEPLR